MANRTANLHVGSLLILDKEPYGRVIYEIEEINQPCRECGGNDAFKIAVITDNGVGSSFGEDYRLPDARVGTSLISCMIKLEKELNPNSFKGYTMYVVPENQIDRIKQEILAEDE